MRRFRQPGHRAALSFKDGQVYLEARPVLATERLGFNLQPDKDELLETYWDIPRRQIETSVVLGINI